MMTGGESKPSTSNPHSSLVRGVHRPQQPLQARLAGPAEDRLEQPAADGGVVHRLEEAEEGGGLFGHAVVIAIDDAGDAAHVLPAPGGDPELHHGVLEQRVGVGEHLLQVHQQRRDPVGVIPVNAVADLQEAQHIPRVAGQRDDLNVIAH